MGRGVIGSTADSGSVGWGSSPCAPAWSMLDLSGEYQTGGHSRRRQHNCHIRVFISRTTTGAILDSTRRLSHYGLRVWVKRYEGKRRKTLFLQQLLARRVSLAAAPGRLHSCRPDRDHAGIGHLLLATPMPMLRQSATATMAAALDRSIGPLSVALGNRSAPDRLVRLLKHPRASVSKQLFWVANWND